MSSEATSKALGWPFFMEIRYFPEMSKEGVAANCDLAWPDRLFVKVLSVRGELKDRLNSSESRS